MSKNSVGQRVFEAVGGKDNVISFILIPNSL